GIPTVSRSFPTRRSSDLSERLAGAGLGLADDVAAAQRDRQGQRLDREGGGDALGGQGLDDVPADIEIGEGLGRLGLCGRAGALLDGGGGRHGLLGVRGGTRHRSTLWSWMCTAIVAPGPLPDRRSVHNATPPRPARRGG